MIFIFSKVIMIFSVILGPKDFFIFESYQDIFSGIRSESFSLDVIPLYGDYEIFYNDISANYINNITSLFSKNNNGTQKIEGITPLNSDMSVFILSCKKPTLIGVKYIGQNININISEGQEITCTIKIDFGIILFF